MCPSWKTEASTFWDDIKLFYEHNLHPSPVSFTRPTGKYRTQLWDKQTGSFLPSTPGLGMHVEIKDPDTKVLADELMRHVKQNES